LFVTGAAWHGSVVVVLVMVVVMDDVLSDVGHSGSPPPVPQKRQSCPTPPALQPTPPWMLHVGS